uniref:Alpha/beta hydrolase fold-3 domain-containing protein n=1 Tax=Tetraselmis chuii TaxID=63592 RepID=A0A7S1X2I7_9CHLO|mmetsp:Transcript_22079/g.39416  ORF Transcript_22079/g.39416 Transcript_22079/m.39416 type:complete len:370 (+) Transcript_22079:1-1110(+)
MELVPSVLFLVLKGVSTALFRRLVLRRKTVASWSIPLECAVAVTRLMVDSEVSEEDVKAYREGSQARDHLVRKRERVTALKDGLTDAPAFPGCAVIPAMIEHIKAEWYVPKSCESSFAAVDSSEKDRTVVINMHGGAFVMGTLNMFRTHTSRMAVTLGMSVIGFEYRLMPKHRFGNILDDAMTMFTHLRDILGYKPSKIVLAGDSAGGHLALSLALHLRQQGFEGPGAVVVLSPWVDPGSYSEDVNSTTGFKEFGHIDIMGKGTQMLQLGSLAFSTDDSYRSLLLPDIVQQARYLPPCLVQVGGCEVFLPAISEFVRLVNNGNTVTGAEKVRFEVFKDQIHGFQMMGDLTPATQQALDSAASFLRDVNL